MVEFFPRTGIFIRKSGEQELGALITDGYVAVGNLGSRDNGDQNILGCKSRTVENCKQCVALGIAAKIGCQKPKKE